jgi:hypothetical protein
MEGRSRLRCWGLWLLEEYGITWEARGIRTEFGGGQVMADLLDGRDSAVPAVGIAVSLHSPIIFSETSSLCLLYASFTPPESPELNSHLEVPTDEELASHVCGIGVERGAARGQESELQETQ